MLNRSQLIADWRVRLAASQTECDDGSVRLRWLRRAYARIYRFLLSQYGDLQEGGDPPLPPQASSMPMVDYTREHLGRPPKSIGKIQATLKHIHNASGRCDEPGPWAAGGGSDLWLVVASARERWIPSKCVSLLRRNGIIARAAQCGGEAVVEVPRKEFGAAAAILESRRGSLTYRRQRSVPRSAPLLFGAVGSAAGVLMGMIFAGFFIYLHHDPKPAVKLIWLFGACGAAAGFVIGCVSLARRSPAIQPATTWTSILAGGVLGGFLGVVFGFAVVPWLVAIMLELTEGAEVMAGVTLTTTTFGLLGGGLLGCWIGYRKHSRLRKTAAANDRDGPTLGQRSL